MTYEKDLLLKAKKFYTNKSFFQAKLCLLKVLENNQIDEKFKLSLYVLISDICYKINEFDRAEKFLLKCIKKGKSNKQIYISLGNIYLKKRDYKNSEKFYQKSIDTEKKNEVAITNLAILYHNLGKKNEAIKLYKKVLKMNPKNIGALYNLSNIDPSIIDNKTIKKLKVFIKRKELGNFNIASSYFLLAKVEKNKKNFKEEMNLISQGNNFSYSENKRRNDQYNNYWLQGIPKNFNKIKYIKDSKYSPDVEDIYPIFIIGLPRSGSTLVESIISSGKDKVENLGETNLVNWSLLNTERDLAERLVKQEEIEINLKEISDKLIGSIKNLNINKKEKKIFFSEKSLENFNYIELILNIYPKAKFINPHRNLVDNIFAIYKQFLPNISWSHSIENILIYIDNYIKILDFFKKKFPDKILSISLENFTKNSESTSKKIYKFCNLKWSKDCLNFHKRRDLFINTASNNQIRKNIQKYDDKKYYPYKEILGLYRNRYDWLKNKN